MAMRTRIAALLALALVLCTPPGARAFAVAHCAPCCPEDAAPVSGPECAPQDSACCELVPAAPATSAEPANPQPPAPAIASVPLQDPPARAALRAARCARELATYSSPSRLSVVRLL